MAHSLTGTRIDPERAAQSALSTDPAVKSWRLCVAPMIDVTDRHCRYFHRLLAPGARLYT